ncbi:hypothetical protein CARUB_v10015645mg [Capsella rubella]|uniref:Uncharacterized protein n=1 Tax=Capsella rubella TaxID=81985 RepID=R0I7E5_9BRAS|nr:uncharacterized protein LOC17891320 [Capsella rubella]EOA32378.1 hypothetical protein CARUB_v10015645mg [Capsella rubella]
MATQENHDLVVNNSNDIISSDVSPSVIPPPHSLTSETTTNDLVATDSALIDDHVAEDDDRVVPRVLDRGSGTYRRSMVWLNVGPCYSMGDYNNHDGDTDEEEDAYNDLDDELVPRNVSKKLKRDRLRKLGKRSSHLQVKRGCVQGKHGFGSKFMS